MEKSRLGRLIANNETPAGRKTSMPEPGIKAGLQDFGITTREPCCWMSWNGHGSDHLGLQFIHPLSILTQTPPFPTFALYALRPYFPIRAHPRRLRKRRSLVSLVMGTPTGRPAATLSYPHLAFEQFNTHLVVGGIQYFVSKVPREVYKKDARGILRRIRSSHQHPGEEGAQSGNKRDEQ